MKAHLRVFVVLLLVTGFAGNAFTADFSVHGYYRNRVVANDDLDLQRYNSNIPYANNRFGFISYNQMRLRLEPTFKLNDYLSLQAQFDVLDNILFGTNQTQQLSIIAPIVGQQTLPPGAGSFYMTGPSTVGAQGAINIRRVWADVFTPIGKFRIGRQPSHWGLGIFQNDGNELQGDFGDSADRILYIIQHSAANASAITGGLLWDVVYEAQWDPRLSGLSSATPMPANSRDTQQYAGLFLFERPTFTIGAFGGVRRRTGSTSATTMTVNDVFGAPTAAGIDGSTLLGFIDLYARYIRGDYKFQFEGVFVGGKVTTGLALNAIPFAGLSAGTAGIIQLPPNQPMRTFLAAFEAEAHYKFGGEWHLWSGFAQGDSNPLSSRITQLGFRPDYQIALMMFYMPLGMSPTLRGQSASGGGTQNLAGGNPVTGNYINNALYFAYGYKHKFDLSNLGWADWVKVGAKAVTAWAPSKNTNINFANLIPQAGNWPAISETANSMFQRWYGLELDLSAEAQLFKSLYTALETGVLFPGRAYDINVALVNPGSIIEPIPKDNADIAWMMRLSAIIQF